MSMTWTRAKAERKLEALGFRIDWEVSGPHPEGGQCWVGVLDPIGNMSLGGSCFGLSLYGNNAAEFYEDAIKEAQENVKWLEPCTNPNCDYHNEETECSQSTSKL
jgi:hypothetical protein